MLPCVDLFQPSEVFLQLLSLLFRSVIKYHYGSALDLHININLSIGWEEYFGHARDCERLRPPEYVLVRHPHDLPLCQGQSKHQTTAGNHHSWRVSEGVTPSRRASHGLAADGCWFPRVRRVKAMKACVAIWQWLFHHFILKPRWPLIGGD